MDVDPARREPHVYTMRSDGSRAVDATPRLAAWSSQPDFSPSGNRIAFVRDYPGAANADLFTMRPNGNQWRRLTGRANNPLGHFSNPSYSPDGRFVVAERTPGVRSSSRLQVIRVRDRARIATLGGRQAPREYFGDPCNGSGSIAISGYDEPTKRSPRCRCG